MRLKRLLIIELETEERAGATVIRSLSGADWAVSILSSASFFERLSSLISENLIQQVEWFELASPSDFDILKEHEWDLVLLLNPGLLPVDYLSCFLKSVGTNRYGVGIFDSRLLSRRKCLSRRARLWNCLKEKSTFFYVSDLDFVNEDNRIAKMLRDRQKRLVVIPFSVPIDIMRKKISFPVTFVISGKVQFKRRSYFFALLGAAVASLMRFQPVFIIINGRAVGLYGSSVRFLAQFISKLFPLITVVGGSNWVDEAEYRQALRSAHLNILPLTRLYSRGKDSGGFYDSIEHGLVSMCPEFYSDSVGTIKGSEVISYSGFFGYIRAIIKFLDSAELYLLRSHSLAEEYIRHDFSGYLNERLTQFCKVER